MNLSQSGSIPQQQQPQNQPQQQQNAQPQLNTLQQLQNQSLTTSTSGIQQQSPYTKIIDLKPFSKNINCIFIVLEKLAPVKKKDFLLYQILVADGTACINMTLFEVYGEQVQPGDILRLRAGYASIFHDSLFLYCGKNGIIEKIGEFTFSFVESPNLSSYQWTKDDPTVKSVVLKQGQPPAGFQGKMKPMAGAPPQQQQAQQPSQQQPTQPPQQPTQPQPPKH